MREISNHFCFIQPDQDLIPPRTLDSVSSAMAVEFVCTRKIVFGQRPVTDSDGRRWRITMSAATTDSRIMAFDGRREFIGVVLSDGSAVVIGTPGMPPAISVTPHENAYQVSVECETLMPYDLP